MIKLERRVAQALAGIVSRSLAGMVDTTVVGGKTELAYRITKCCADLAPYVAAALVIAHNGHGCVPFESSTCADASLAVLGGKR